MTFKKGQVNFELDNEQYSNNGILKKDSIFHVPEDVTLREYQKDAEYQVGLIKIIKAFFQCQQVQESRIRHWHVWLIWQKTGRKVGSIYSLSLHSFSRTVGGR